MVLVVLDDTVVCDELVTLVWLVVLETVNVVVVRVVVVVLLEAVDVDSPINGGHSLVSCLLYNR